MTKCQVLIADDDPAMAAMLEDGLRDLGYRVTAVTKASEAVRLVQDDAFDVLVTDLRMPDVDGLELLTSSMRVAPERPVIVMTAFGAIDTAVESLRRGAYHYLLKPFKVAELDLFLQRAIDDRAVRREARTLKRAFGSRYSTDNVVANSDAMRGVLELVDRVADADVPVLLAGETGSGKGLIARTLHARSARAGGPFVSVNCAALPENLLESELFGHVKGAFTGASQNRRGLFAEADGGTLFLDEIGDMAAPLQAKLLHVLEQRAVRALGASRDREVDVRVVSASHRDLRERVAAGLFREDLMYRLEGVAIEIPPLRQRRDDIPLLVERFLAEARAANPKAVVQRLAREAMDRVMEYSWPGNVRELWHATSRVVLLGRDVDGQIGDLPPSVASPAAARTQPEFSGEVMAIRELQRRYAAWALERLGGRKALTCEKLNIDAKTLNKWLLVDDARED
jgi:two-component system response regulator HydG